MRYKLPALALIALTILGTVPAHAQTETKVMVRAVAHDAKIIGSHVGGARIVIQDAATGDVLAEGVQEGSTGDTRKIVVDPIARGATVYDTEGAAGFLATLSLDAPTLVDINAYGPLGTPAEMVRTTKRTLLVPGKDVLGEGIILELNGFTVQVLEPTAVVQTEGMALDVKARVTMLCGCPTEPGGLWDADDIEIVARLVRDGEVVAEAPLAYAGEQSTYTGSFAAPAAGPYQLQVLASDTGKGNFGMAERSVVVR